MNWKENSHFQSGERGNIGALKKGDWTSQGAALWQWRGLWAHPNRTKVLIKAMQRVGEPPALNMPWFENAESVLRCLSRLPHDSAGAAMLEWASVHQQVLAAVQSQQRQHYNDGYQETEHPLSWAISVQSAFALRAFLNLGTGRGWDCLKSTFPEKGPLKEHGPLPHALRTGWWEGVNILREYGAECEDSLLAIAALSGQARIVSHLIAEGADIHHRDPKGQTILGRMGRHISSILFRSGSNSLTPEQEQRLITCATPLLQRGARLDVHDGKTQRAATVIEIWSKSGGYRLAQQIKTIASGHLLHQKLTATLPEGNEGKGRSRL